MSIRYRLGFDAGDMGLEDALAWAAHHDFHFVNFNNVKPADAEVHYLGHTVEECRYYFDAIASAHFGWPLP